MTEGEHPCFYFCGTSLSAVKLQKKWVLGLHQFRATDLEQPRFFHLSINLLRANPLYFAMTASLQSLQGYLSQSVKAVKFK